MADSSDGGKSSGPLQAIIIGVIIALATGGSAPFWWQYVFPGHQTPAKTNGTNLQSTTGPTSGGQSTPQPRSTMSAIERRTNLSGGDLAGNGLESNSSEECSNLCLHDNGCKAMTFVYHPAGGGGVCWLKNAVPAPSSNPSMDSAIKLYP